jgi:choline dehydrogenase
MNEAFDYIVVGGGSAGCVVASRLSQRPEVRVLLLEAGPHDKTLWVRVPAAFFKLHGTARRWEYETEAAPSAAGRSMSIPQGRTLGGGSSVNGMMYVRGQRADYDGWAAAGCAGWSYEEVLPYFRKSEGNQRLAGHYHGTEGPLKVGDPAGVHPLAWAFTRAAMEIGEYAGRPIRYNPDFNGETQEGVGLYQTTIGHGERSSTAAAFLYEARRRPNLVVRTGAHVHRVILSDDGAAAGGPKRASGVAYSLGDRTPGPEIVAEARCEVVVCAGAIASPKILLLSGIGPGEHLHERGVAVQVDRPAVGANFHDHMLISVAARLREPISLYGHDKGWRAFRHALQWAALRTGVLSTNVLEAGGFFDIDGDGRPEVQMHLVPRLPYAPGQPSGEHGLTASSYALACKSRGDVRLRNRDPRASAILRTGYLDHPDDIRLLESGFLLARRVLRSPSMARLLTGEEIGATAGVREEDAAALETLMREQARTVYHPAGTCRMGSDAEAVVDTRLRVRGVRDLRVADASVMPTITRGNTNAPAIMIGERAAAFLDEDRGHR